MGALDKDSQTPGELQNILFAAFPAFLAIADTPYTRGLP
jgi:hypothetical protein